MEYYTNLNEMKAVIKDVLLIEADENVENYDINEILDKVSDYDVDECAFYFTDAFYSEEEFWEIAEEYTLNKDYSDMSNQELLNSLEEAIDDENEFMTEQFRTEILKRMN